MGNKIGISEAAKALGVTPTTLRRWEKAEKIEVERTPNGHRRYDLSKMYGLAPRPPLSSRPTIGYARVSSHDQKSDLTRQVALLESYCAANGWSYEIIQDLGSGLNYNKKKDCRRSLNDYVWGKWDVWL
jgi:predicted site-specific integrase-resolvase